MYYNPPSGYNVFNNTSVGKLFLLVFLLVLLLERGKYYFRVESDYFKGTYRVKIYDWHLIKNSPSFWGGLLLRAIIYNTTLLFKVT